MAALGKIRSKGVILITVIGFALFAFIAEEMFRSCDSIRNENRQQVGEVFGEKVNVQDFQKLVDEYTNVMKVTQGRENLTDMELNQIKDVVWNTYVQNKLIEKEAKELGLTVTDKELQNVLAEGTNPMLMQTPFVNQQTGRFDVNALKKFLAEYKQAQTVNPQMAEQYRSIYNFWTFVEKSLRQQILAQKYQTLFAGCILSNPVSAKIAYNDENQESNIQLAAYPYSSVKDDDIKVSDDDLKAKYDELKPRFKQHEESRDVKYVELQVLPSQTDRVALDKTFKSYAQDLQNAADPSEVVRKSASYVAYLGIPQTKTAFPSDIASRLDSIAVGAMVGPFENKSDNTLNIIRLLSKTQMPDSVQFRAIQVAGATPEAARKTADSIYTALQGGADFEALAKKYGQTGEKTWITSAQYQNAPSMDKDTKTYISALNTSAVNETKNLQLAQFNLILQVTDRKAMTDKYTVAVIKKPIEFSKDTYSAAYNKFSQFVSENQTLDAMEKNASKYGFTVQERKDLTNAEHGVNGIRSTRDALKWIFEAKAGEVSPLYECGDNDRMMVIAMTKIHPVGYRALEDVKDIVKSEVIRDKKFEQLSGKLAGAKSISEAKSKGADVTEIAQVTFNAPAFVPATRTSEPALSGAVAATKQGQFCPRVIKGNGGAFMVKVKTKAQRAGEKFDSKAFEKRLHEQAMMAANPNRLIGELYLKSDVVDNRYLFF